MAKYCTFLLAPTGPRSLLVYARSDSQFPPITNQLINLPPRAMLATVAAAVATAKVVGLGHYHKALFVEVVISMLPFS